MLLSMWVASPPNGNIHIAPGMAILPFLCRKSPMFFVSRAKSCCCTSSLCWLPCSSPSWHPPTRSRPTTTGSESSSSDSLATSFWLIPPSRLDISSFKLRFCDLILVMTSFYKLCCMYVLSIRVSLSHDLYYHKLALSQAQTLVYPQCCMHGTCTAVVAWLIDCSNNIIWNCKLH